MKNFKSGGGRFGGGGNSRFGGDRGGRPSFGGSKRSFGGGDDRGGRGELVMHQATCADCNSTCEVPFRPVDGRPVYCRDCFGNNKPDTGTSRPPRHDFGDRPQRPSFDAPRGGSNDDLKKQMEAINAKLDRVISALENLSNDSSPKKKEASGGLTLSEAVSAAVPAKKGKVAKKAAKKGKK